MSTCPYPPPFASHRLYGCESEDDQGPLVVLHSVPAGVECSPRGRSDKSTLTARRIQVDARQPLPAAPRQVVVPAPELGWTDRRAAPEDSGAVQFTIDPESYAPLRNECRARTYRSFCCENEHSVDRSETARLSALQNRERLKLLCVNLFLGLAGCGGPADMTGLGHWVGPRACSY